MHELKIENVSQLRSQMVRAWHLVNKGIQGGKLVVEIKRWNKSRDQEKKYHAMIRDIHQGAFRGNSFEGVKALIVAEFAAEMKEQGAQLTHPGETVYSYRLKEWITVRPSTRKFRKSEAIAFIEYLYWFGCELNVKWSEPALAIYSEYKEAA